MATGAEIANAYVAVTVKMPGVQGDISRALGGPGVQSTIAGSGKSMGAALAGAVGGAVAAVTSKAIDMVMGSIDGAIKRVDLLNNFPKIMQNLGYSAEDAQKSIQKISDKLIGLPTSADAMAGVVQQIAPLTGGLGEATDLSLALNNALLAGGKATETQSNAMVQYSQMLALGKVDMTAWRSMTDAMPAQLGQISKALLGPTAGTNDLYDAMKAGEVGFDQFNAAILDLNENGLGEFASFADQAKDATDGIGTSQANLGTAITRGLASLIAKYQPQITAMFAGVTLAVNDTFKAISGTFDWIGENSEWLTPLAIGLGIVAGGFVAMGAAATITAAGGLTKWMLATKAGAAAQALFNVVMNANPIMLVVTAIAAIVGGLVYFFTQTELGQKIWGEFTQFLGEAWANISGFFVAAWENVIQPIFQAIGDIAVWLYETILKPVFDGIAGVVEFLGAAFKFHFDLIVNAFRFVGALAEYLWKKALEPAFAAIGAVVVWLWETIMVPAFAAIGAAFEWLWLNVIKPVSEFIGAGLKLLGDAFVWLNENVVQPVWKGIQDAMKAAWTWIDQNVFTPFKAGIDLIAQGFEVAKSAIEKTWEGIKAAAAVPINFVLDTIWNKGLRSFWNDLVTELGLKDMMLPAAPLVKFASGGVLPGYTPGQDVHQFYSPTGGRLALSGGEAIMRPEFTRAVGGVAGVNRLNAMARSGQAFKNGGVWNELGNFAGDVMDNIGSAVSLVGEFLTDPAQAIQKHIIDGLIRPLMGDGNIFMKSVAQMPINLVRDLAKNFIGAPGKGTAGMGSQAMWDIVKNAVPGARMTSGDRPGAKTVGGGTSFHSMGRAIDLVPASMATFDAVRRLFPNAAELIYTPAGAKQLLRGKPFAGWSPAVQKQHYNHVHLAMADGGVVPQLFDQGGWLPHGGMAVNRSGKPEAVLTNDESRALRNGGSLDGVRELVLVDTEGRLLERIRVEAQSVLRAAAPSRGAVHSLVAGM